MIASMLFLDRQSIKILSISDPYSIHKLVYDLFPGEQRTFLYFDHGGDIRGRRILILSRNQPQLPAAGEIRSKKIPENFLFYQEYAFQIRINPVIRKPGDKRCIPITGREEIKSWFLGRQQDWGFSVYPDKLEITDVGVQRIKTGTKEILHNKATCIGVLSVQDRDLFITSFKQGIGRGKAFGFGLLQLRPLQHKSSKKEI